MHNIALIGYRATGKSTVAQLLGKRLGWPVVDTDQEIQRRAGMSIRELFAEGEVAFRDWETAVLRDVCREPRRVLSLGGGAVVRSENRPLLQDSLVVWLQADVDTIVARMHGDRNTREQRPVLTTGGREEVEQLLAQRYPIYRSLAQLALDTTQLTPQQLCERIANVWNRSDEGA